MAQHPITEGISTVTLYDDGHVTGPAETVMLLQDYRSFNPAAVLEVGPNVGDGRVFVLGDKDAITDTYTSTDPSNLKFSDNISRWAIEPPARVKGSVSLANYFGNPAGVQIVLRLYSGMNLVETLTGTLDSSGSYSVLARHTGTYDVIAKARQWLSVRRNGIAVDGPTAVDWQFDYNGDANNDNAVNLLDLSMVLLAYNETGPNDADLTGDGQVNLLDLALILLDFNLKGEA